MLLDLRKTQHVQSATTLRSRTAMPLSFVTGVTWQSIKVSSCGSTAVGRDNQELNTSSRMLWRSVHPGGTMALSEVPALPGTSSSKLSVSADDDQDLNSCRTVFSAQPKAARSNRQTPAHGHTSFVQCTSQKQASATASYKNQSRV